MKLPKRLPFLFLLVLPILAQAKWADPSGFFSNERISEKEIRPGVRWISAHGKLDNQPLQTEVIAVDLTRADLALQSLYGERYAKTEAGHLVLRSTTSQLLEDNNALAAINVAFFDISGTMTFFGLHMRDGLLLASPDSGRATMIYHPDGRAAIANLQWKAQVKIGEQRRPLVGINRNSLGSDEVMLFLPPWSQSPGNEAKFTQGQKPLEIVVEKTVFTQASDKSERSRLTGKIVEIRENKTGVKIAENQFVLAAGPSAAPFFRNATEGAEIEISWELSGTPTGFDWHEITEAVSASPLLIADGKKRGGSTSLWTARHPRSAVGISRDGTQVIFVVVDGRSKTSAGISLASLIEYLAHMDAYNALNFDGGGSSAIAANLNGSRKVLNRPSGGTERLVPSGIGVVTRPGAEELQSPRTWTGANGREMSGSFQSYDPASETVSLILAGRRYTLPLSSLSEPDQQLILRTHKNQ